MSLNLDSFVSIPISNELYAKFVRRFPDGVSSALEQIAQDFLERTVDDFVALELRTHNIYWDALFLPEGNQIRTKHYGGIKVAEVVAAKIIWK